MPQPSKSIAKSPVQPVMETAHDPSELRHPNDPDKTREQQLADLAVGGIATNAAIVQNFVKGSFGDVGLTETMMSLRASSQAVNANDLASAEAMLISQATALNSIFGEMMRRAALNMGEFPDSFERYMRLGLKSQGQCRATLESLATIKNPPVFAKQANINNGGQQQVNNGTVVAGSRENLLTGAQEIGLPQNKLLEEAHGERLDFGATRSASGADTVVAAVVPINRPSKRSRQGNGGA